MNNGDRYSATRLAEVLEDQGRKQRWLASQIGIHESIVSDWINGRRTLSEDRAKQVAEALAIDFYLLFPVPNGTDSVSSEAA